jgi:predicted PurR-regulated permease PerM
MIVGTIMSITTLAVLALAGPVEQWLNDAPTAIRGLQDDLLRAKGPMADFQELADEVNELGKVDAPSKTPSVVIQGPGLLENAIGNLPSMLASVGVVIFLSFFMMASGDSKATFAKNPVRAWQTSTQSVARR